METVSENDQMAELLDKCFKTTILEMFKELKEDTGKVKQMMHELNGYIIKVIENLKGNEKNSGTEH